MDSILKKNEVPEVDEMLELVNSLSDDEKQALNYMIQGIRLAKKLERESVTS